MALKKLLLTILFLSNTVTSPMQLQPAREIHPNVIGAFFVLHTAAVIFFIIERPTILGQKCDKDRNATFVRGANNEEVVDFLNQLPLRQPKNKHTFNYEHVIASHTHRINTSNNSRKALNKKNQCSTKNRNLKH